MRYCPLEQLLDMMGEPNSSLCKRILEENRERFSQARGARSNHQAWVGGYLDHVQETMNIALVLFKILHVVRPLTFAFSDALLVLFLHDLEKPWKYERASAGGWSVVPGLEDKRAQHEFRFEKIREYGIVLTEEQENALRYVEGEGADYTNTRRVMGPLAAFCHLCDVTSARIWFDCPKPEKDPWRGAHRYVSK